MCIPFAGCKSSSDDAGALRDKLESAQEDVKEEKEEKKEKKEKKKKKKKK